MSQLQDDEIDLFELLQTLWDGKWKIVGAVVTSILGVFGFQSFTKQNFQATLEIKPITTFIKIVLNNKIIIN